MARVKRLSTPDCVVGGFRYETGSREVGSLLLGLYDEDGRLDHVGFTSSIADDGRKPLTKQLQGFCGEPGFCGQAPAGPSRRATVALSSGSRAGATSHRLVLLFHSMTFCAVALLHHSGFGV